MSRLTTTARMDVLRARVLRLLEETDAGASENWRDSDPGYWIGAAEGAYAAERERDEALEVLREVVRLRAGHSFDPMDIKNAPGHGHMDRAGFWDVSNSPSIAGKRCEWCALWDRIVVLAARSGGSDRGEGERG